MRVLVTGGSGFVGSHFVDKLVSENHEVLVFDNLITGSKDNILDHIESDVSKVTFIEGDVQNFIEIKGDIDVVAHFASIASPKAYVEHPINTLKSGSQGTINTLGLAKAKNAKYLLTSTSEVYGDPLISPQKEDYWGNVNPNGARSMYDESKRFAEAAAFAYMRTYDLDIKVARLFNTYGPRMKLNDGRVVTNFMCQAVTNQDITIYGDGSQTRSLCYISDMVEYLYRLMNSNFTGVMNLGNPEEITILELANKIKEKTTSDSLIKYIDLPMDDPKQRKPDITLAKKELNYEPKVLLDEGLDKMIAWGTEKINH